MRSPSALATPESDELLSAGAMAANATSGNPAATVATPMRYLSRRLALSVARGIGPPPRWARVTDGLHRTSLQYSYVVSPSTRNYALHQKTSQAAGLAAHPARLAGNAVVAQPGQQLLEGDLDHELAGVGPDAAVGPGAEAEVVVGVPVEDDLAGPVEGLGVTVPRRPEEEDPVPGPDRAAAELGVAGHRAAQPLHRRGDPDELLDRRVEPIRIGQQPGPVVGMVGQMGQGHGDGTRRGVEAAEEEQRHREELLVVVERPAFDLGVEEDAHEVLASRLAPPLLEPLDG